MNELKLKSWLKGQLTKVKQAEQPWSDLASALGELMSNHVEGYLDRLRVRGSLYDMSKQDLLEEARELRKVFSLGDVSDQDLPHVITQRMDEIHFKKTVYPMISTIAREFNGMEVDWIRLYAPVDQSVHPYGSLFAQEDELDDFHGIPREDFFLTSRGVIRIPITMIQSGSSGVGESEILEFEKKITNVIYPLIPLKVVCDGQVYYITTSLLDVIERVEFWSNVSTAIPPASEIPDRRPAQGSTACSIIETPEERQATVIRARPRMGANPFDAITLDSVYY